MRKYRYSQGGEEYTTYNKKRKTNWVGHTLRRNCLLKLMKERQKEEVKGRQGRRRKQLLDGIKEMIGH